MKSKQTRFFFYHFSCLEIKRAAVLSSVVCIQTYACNTRLHQMNYMPPIVSIFFSSPCGRTQEHLLKRFSLADPNANTR